IKISLAFAEQENVFVAFSRPVGATLRHWVRLVPDNIASQIPAVSLQREGYPPGNADKILRFEPRCVLEASCVSSPWMCLNLSSREHRAALKSRPVVVSVLPALRSPTAGITIPQIQPQRPIFPQDTSHLAKYIDHLRHIFLRRRLEAELLIDAPCAAQGAIAGEGAAVPVVVGSLLVLG